MRHGSLFSGIGGFDLAAEWMGWENIFHCEWNKFCQKVLKYHFPNAITYDDISKTDFTVWNGRIDIITGGFPCQPYSQAGKRKGKDDERHLWPEMLRAIREIQPGWIVGENVPGLLNWNGGMVLAEIKSDLESEGFEVFPPCILPACAKDAPHRRDRLWIVAYSDSKGKMVQRGNGNCNDEEWNSETQIQKRENKFFRIEQSGYAIIADTNGNQRSERWLHQTGQTHTERYVSTFDARRNERNTWKDFPAQSPLCGGNDGISNRMDRIKALGNAIVPQVAYEIFKAIEETEKQL